MAFTYKIYNVASDNGFIDFKRNIPDEITTNLKYPLRPYQKEALGRYLYYKDDEKHHTDPEQVLFNMATGSGKTLLMAAVMLEKYRQGERNFIFFVNNDNILTKTRSNFLAGNANKYLFDEKIVIDNQIVTVREVSDFSDSRDDSINIVFTTIQKLHQDLNTPRENRLSFEQFKDISVVLLADESHHLNAGLNSSEKEDNTSWTSTVDNIQRAAKKSSIFEFTATVDLTDINIAQKYEKSLIFKYDLKEFRLDKYSKDVLFHLVDGDANNRMLQAILISQYRKKIALKNNINLKPLIMFKSKVKKENKGNLDNFLELLERLSVEQIANQRQIIRNNDLEKAGILTKAFEYFENNNISDQDLIEELKDDFRQERLLLLDSDNKTKDNLTTINTLEDPRNEIRAIFAVDMLNEGWDVLNLFDIVRLYDTRDGKITKKGFKAGKTTNAEKQLIGRGARYYPFVIDDKEDEKYTRKFDDNETKELRVIEQLHYHSANNPRYISELKQVLRESGIFDDITLVKRELKLKDSFTKTRTYKDGVVWMNKRLSREEYLEEVQESLDEVYIPKSFEVELPTLSTFDIEAFEEDDRNINSTTAIDFKLEKVIPKNIVRTAINRNKKFTFDNLRKYIFGLGSISLFIKMLKDIDLRVICQYKNPKELTADDKLYVVEKLLKSIEKDLIPTEERFYGSEKFEKTPIKKVFETSIIRKYSIDENSEAEFGVSQKDSSETKIFEDLDTLDWYAYDDNFGTSEEKYLVRTIKSLMSDLEQKWTDIYLLRNEKAVKIYSFDKGQAFEPDFLMFANDKKTGNVSWQIFIEPKGRQFLDSNQTFENGKEGWKLKFLQQISERDNARILVDDEKHRIIGLPFYNEEITKEEVKTTLRELGS
ncbi:DEAD/DEAH box helicase family protein [Ligilactobacillus faecis]|uniref:DEAD/DEAH box helicase family protein n=1 Tax=Ligilactobacillus faecis TaxID=762833 RepID=UPI0024688110|nr:DEAD/DEAH box helicase family protein [Ligilactobacillus faecis]WGN88629.1 DEAD/DEAH box helicase family protein [Ligilactobacillus faecis]